MMKYISNHSEHFTNPHIAFTISLSDYLINICAEVMNIYMLLYQYKVDYCIIHFVALEIIVEIPGIYMNALIDDNLKARMFSSHQLEVTNKGSEIQFSERSFLNKIERCIYRINRSIYVSIIFYFCPFIVVYIYRFLE
jgi:hypothetical protein